MNFKSTRYRFASVHIGQNLLWFFSHPPAFTRLPIRANYTGLTHCFIMAQVCATGSCHGNESVCVAASALPFSSCLLPSSSFFIFGCHMPSFAPSTWVTCHIQLSTCGLLCLPSFCKSLSPVSAAHQSLQEFSISLLHLSCSYLSLFLQGYHKEHSSGSGRELWRR